MESSVSTSCNVMADWPSDAYGENEPEVVAPNKVYICSPFAGFISGKDAYLTNGVKSMHSNGNDVSFGPLCIPPLPYRLELIAA